ncbi:MAG: MFS transporter, partial [Candidatus Peregrinibacteria bacterium]|nr:MFS transporter [Candidatus Peregrinibacteria bacterium]
MFLLNKKLGITENEAARVKVLWALRLLYQIGFVVSWTIITALFVEHFGINNLIFLFSTDAVLFILGTCIASFAWSRMKLSNFLIYATLFTTLFLGIAFQFSTESLGFFIFVILAKDLFFAQLNIALFRQSESLLSPTEAQKLMPIIESAITVGTILGAALTVQFLEFLDTKFVLVLWGMALLAMTAIIFFIPKFLHFIPKLQNEDEEEKPKRSPLLEGIHGLKKIPFLRYVLGILVLQAVVFTIIEFEFTKDVQSHIVPHETHQTIDAHSLQSSFFQTAKNKLFELEHKAEEKIDKISSKLIAHETLAHDLGMFHLLFGIFALLIQLVVTSRILGRIGVIGSIISYFGVLLAGLISVIFGFLGISYLRGIQHGFHSIGESAYHISFYSIFSHSRESVRLFFEGIAKPVGILLGVLFIFVAQNGHSEFIFYVATIATALAILIGIFAKKSFTSLSQKNLKSKQNVEAKLHSIEVLGQKGHGDSFKILGEELLRKELHPVIRKKIIATCTRINNPKIIHEYAEILTDRHESDEIKIEVLESALHLEGLPIYLKEHAFAQDNFLKTLQNLFKMTNHAHLKKLVVMNLFKNLHSEKLVSFFTKNMNAHDDKLKSIFLRSATVLKDDPDIVFYLRPYLKHKNPRIKGHAIISLWEHDHHDTLRPHLSDLMKADDENSKIAAIYAIGEVQDTKNEEKLLNLLETEVLRESRLLK